MFVGIHSSVLLPPSLSLFPPPHSSFQSVWGFHISKHSHSNYTITYILISGQNNVPVSVGLSDGHKNYSWVWALPWGSRSRRVNILLPRPVLCLSVFINWSQPSLAWPYSDRSPSLSDRGSVIQWFCVVEVVKYSRTYTLWCCAVRSDTSDRPSHTGSWAGSPGCNTWQRGSTERTFREQYWYILFSYYTQRDVIKIRRDMLLRYTVWICKYLRGEVSQ